MELGIAGALSMGSRRLLMVDRRQFRGVSLPGVKVATLVSGIQGPRVH